MKSVIRYRVWRFLIYGTLYAMLKRKALTTGLSIGKIGKDLGGYAITEMVDDFIEDSFSRNVEVKKVLLVTVSCNKKASPQLSYVVAQNSTARSRETGVFSPHIKTSELYIVDEKNVKIINFLFNAKYSTHINNILMWVEYSYLLREYRVSYLDIEKSHIT